MLSRIAKQKKQDSDRQDDREPSSVKGEVMEIGTNKTLRDAEVRKKTPVAVRSNAVIETSGLRASSQEKKVDLGPTDHHHSSHFFYFPQNYSFPPHYSQPRYGSKSNPYHHNQSYRNSRSYYLHLPFQLPPSKPFEVTHDNDDEMAPFDDTTLATSNVTKKRKTGNLKIDTNPTMKHRNERFTRPYSPPYYPPPSYGEFYPRLSPYQHHEAARSPHGPHFEFFDIDSPRDYEYPYSTTPIAVDTPQRSNVTPQAEARDQSEGPKEDANWKHDRTVSGHYDQPVPPPPLHKVRRQAYPPPFSPHNGWRVPYERPQESFSREEPYDRHYFCPSPPPPPPFPDNYVPSSDGFSSRAASPSMSWYEDSHGSFDEPIRPPAVPHYYSRPPGAYHYPYPPTQEHQDKQHPRTPSSNQSPQNISTVTPAKPTGRNSPCPSNADVKMDQVPPLSKARTVTPDDKNRASTFAPSSPFGTLGDNDIVCGRGAPVNHHIGNERFRELVLGYNKSYFVAKRSEKPKIAMKILDVLATRGSRFVRKIKGASSVAARWEEVSHKIAYEKVCQALRDAGGPDVKEMLTSPSKRKVGSPMRENGGSNKRQRLAYGPENATARTGEEGKENGSVDPY